MIVTFMLEPKVTEVVGISNLMLVFGFLNILKKPTAFYLRLVATLKIKFLFIICASLVYVKFHLFTMKAILTLALYSTILLFSTLAVHRLT